MTDKPTFGDKPGEVNMNAFAMRFPRLCSLVLHEFRAIANNPDPDDPDEFEEFDEEMSRLVKIVLEAPKTIPPKWKGLFKA
jgi:hypothetical protein